MSSRSQIITCLILAALSSLLKLLFVTSYKSTDFAVHRNWLAITNKLPYKRWYFENTSEWTLDYPPFFAWFEHGLSRIGQLFDDESGMLEITIEDPDSVAALYFQRFSVIISDFVLYYGTYSCCSTLNLQGKGATSCETRKKVLMVLIFFNAGLITVDHIHFQYNGFLFGILFLSLYNILEENILWGAFWFAVLLNFKHIFLYMAPAYGIFLLRTYCLNAKLRGLDLILSFNVRKFISLSCIVLGVFAVSYGPFWDHFGQVFMRLFPFKRGLTHAYWAPNFWALYNTADKMLTVIGKRFNLFAVNDTAVSSLSKGLVEDLEHIVLPNVPPIVTFGLVVSLIVPCFLDICFFPKSLTPKLLSNQFLRAVILVSLTSFMFGWHVHEKAILMVILPLALLALRGSKKDAEIFILLHAVGNFSLFPLLYKPFETVSKLSMSLLYGIFCFLSLQHLHRNSLQDNLVMELPMLSFLETLYIIGLLVSEVYIDYIHQFMPYAENLQFMPLMLSSAFSACGVTWCWLKLYYAILSDRSGLPIEWDKGKKVV